MGNYWYINAASNNKNLQTIGIYDKELRKIKLLSSKEKGIKQSGSKKVLQLAAPIFKFETWKNKIYLVDEDSDFHIKVFDANYDLTFHIKPRYNRIKVSDEYKQKRIEEFKNLPGVKKRWHYLKNKVEYSFPKYFPAIKDFLVADGKIFVNTYLENEGKEEYWILSLTGKLVKKVFLPKVKPRYRTIANGQFYYLFENEDDEQWELHDNKIK